MLGLKRHEMRILTSARGLVAGDFSFQVRGEAWVRCSEHTAEGGEDRTEDRMKIEE
jgi:DNA topoisomerase VI subunit A